jgi:hypothetical protein
MGGQRNQRAYWPVHTSELFSGSLDSSYQIHWTVTRQPEVTQVGLWLEATLMGTTKRLLLSLLGLTQAEG